jgi:hypothetical protein
VRPAPPAANATHDLVLNAFGFFTGSTNASLSPNLFMTPPFAIGEGIGTRLYYETKTR